MKGVPDSPGRAINARRPDAMRCMTVRAQRAQRISYNCGGEPPRWTPTFVWVATLKTITKNTNPSRIDISTPVP
jgi:hypothetical protein